MDEFTKRAILSAIKAEKKSHDLYYLAARHTTDPEARNFLMRLACDEFEHMSGFISIYPEGESELTPLLNESHDGNAFAYKELLEMLTQITTWDQALSIAKLEEQACIEQYSILIDAIQLPDVKGMFRKALEETEQHLESINTEYARRMNMADDAGTNSMQ
jgi:rubrerythrin